MKQGGNTLSTLYLDGETLTIEDIKSFLQQQSKIEIIDDALERRKKVER